MTILHCCENGLTGRGLGHPAAWGIVWDFLSLPQRGYTSGYVPDECDENGKVVKSNDDRTPYQLVRFAKGLKSINVVGLRPSKPMPFPCPCLSHTHR